jgi:hypothetical protein
MESTDPTKCLLDLLYKMLMTVAAWSKAPIVFYHSKFRVVNSLPTPGMIVYGCFVPVFKISCACVEPISVRGILQIIYK